MTVIIEYNNPHGFGSKVGPKERDAVSRASLSLDTPSFSATDVTIETNPADTDADLRITLPLGGPSDLSNSTADNILAELQSTYGPSVSQVNVK